MVKIRGKTWTLAAVALLTFILYHNILRIYYVSKTYGTRDHAPRLSGKEAEDAGFAYVFYATSDSYACSALVNIHQLQTLGSTVPIHVLASEKVSQAYIDAFTAAGATTHVEPPPKLPLQPGHYYEDCLLKLVVFKMHKMDRRLRRVLLFDSDQLILKHFDNLFSDIPPADLAAPRAYWLSAETAVFSSAFMLINLSDRLWAKVNKTFPTGGADLGGAEERVDMDIMNDELGDTATILSGEYVTLNSHWEAWDLPNWYHPEDRHNSSHARAGNPGSNKAARSGRPDDQVPFLATALTSGMAPRHPEDSDIYKQLVALYEYTPIIHFTALGKPWTYTADQIIRQRRRAHPAFAMQFGHWRNVAEQVCPEGYLTLTGGAAVADSEASSHAGVDGLS